MKNAKAIIAAVLLLALLLSACGSTSSQAAQYKVYFIAKSTETEFWKSAFAGANAAKAEYNINLIICGPETEEDFEAQNEYIEAAIAAQADAIVFSAISYTENAAAINAAAEHGIKIVVIDSDVDSDRVSLRIGTDNVQAGRMTATAALDNSFEEIVIGIVNYDLGSRNGQEREEGLREELANNPRVGGIYTTNVLTTPEDAKNGAMALLAEHPEINVLIGLNEPLAVGVAMAVDEFGLAGRVHAVVFDTNAICVDLMRSGAVSAMIVQNQYAMGYLGVEYAWKLLEGESFDSSEWIDTSTTIITRENMFTVESQKALFSFG